MHIDRQQLVTDDDEDDDDDDMSWHAEIFNWWLAAIL